MGCNQTSIQENQFIYRIKNQHMWKNHLTQPQITQLLQRVQQIQLEIANQSCKLCSNDIIKKGTWHQNKKSKQENGKGVIYKRMKDFFFGLIQKGEANGQGILLRIDKTVYKGSFKNDKANGKGKVYIQDTKFIFEGQWKQGVMLSGKFISSKVRIKALKKENNFEIIYNDHITFTGQAILNQQQIVLNGFGILINSKQKYKYAGQWKNNLKQGIGKAYYENKKHIFQGEFKNNLKNGKGKYIISDTQYYDGIWKDDQIVEATLYQNGQQVSKYPSPSQIII